jgi:hypothetical protein
MQTLRRLKCCIQDNSDATDTIRATALECAGEVARAFEMAEETFREWLETLPDDNVGARLLLEIAEARARTRGARCALRLARAQASADVLGQAAGWEGDRCLVDVVSLLAATLTRPGDELRFECPSWTAPVSFGMDILFEVARLERADLSAWVDPAGLHIRWRTGGLNLHPSSRPNRDAVTVHLPARGAARSAA